MGILCLTRKKILGVLISVTLCLTWIYGQPAYEYNCEGTFNPDNSSISLTKENQNSCSWKFDTHADETFRLTFRNFGVDRISAYCGNHYVAIRDRHLNIRHCGNHPTPYSVEIFSNAVTIRSWKRKQYAYFSFNAFLTRDIKSQLKVYDTPMTWTEAAAVCKGNGGYLAETYPVVSEQLYQVISTGSDRSMPKRNKRGYWNGKSLTPWVMLHGCVRLDRNTSSVQAYKISKYNQMSECASVCSGYLYFLLQKASCHCVMELEEKTLTYVPNTKCDSRCPGMPEEKCGGRNLFTLYKYYFGEIIKADRTYNCVSKKGLREEHRESSCESEMGFTCKLKDGSLVTYNPGIPGREKSLSWHKALDFCTSLKDSVGMSPSPTYPQPYFSEPYWTTIRRTVDWHYDTVAQRHPELGSVAALDRLGDYIEYFKNSSEKRGFVCQNDFVSCGQEEEADTGNITSPDYPLPYKKRQLCEWDITVNESKIVKLLVADMDIEDSPGCIYDYLLVKENNRAGERLCGRQGIQYILTKNNTVTLVFRSDDTVTGQGFIVQWWAADPSTDSDRNPAWREYSHSLSGGAVVGITIAAATFFVIVASLLACVVYRKRHPREHVPVREETSIAHNVIYAISSFNTSSFTDEDDKSYQNVSQTRSKYNLKAAISYANDPNKRSERSSNVYQTIHKKGDTDDVTIEEGSKANLLLDSDSSTFGSLDSTTPEERTKAHSTDAAEVVTDGATGIDQPSTFDMSNIDNLGRDCIKVVSVENVAQEDMKSDAVSYDISKGSSATYMEIVPDRTTDSPDTREEDAYLNEGLDSNTRMPHYEDISASPEDTHYIQMDQTQTYSEMTDRTSNTYMEL